MEIPDHIKSALPRAISETPDLAASVVDALSRALGSRPLESSSGSGGCYLWRFSIPQAILGAAAGWECSFYLSMRGPYLSADGFRYRDANEAAAVGRLAPNGFFEVSEVASSHANKVCADVAYSLHLTFLQRSIWSGVPVPSSLWPADIGSWLDAEEPTVWNLLFCEFG
jgi:hypothetical protein